MHKTFTMTRSIFITWSESLWQRGSNENTIGVLRRYFPRTTDLSVPIQAAQLAAIKPLSEKPSHFIPVLKLTTESSTPNPLSWQQLPGGQEGLKALLNPCNVFVKKRLQSSNLSLAERQRIGLLGLC